MREMIHRALSKHFSNIDAVADGAQAITHVNRKVYDLILLDMELPHVSGVEVLEHVRSHAQSTPVIILTGSTDIRLAVTAMKLGAFDYLSKPFQHDELMFHISRALDFKRLNNSAEILERSRKQRGSDEGVVGKSNAWLEILEQARRFAETDFLIYLQGETGSGKEVVASYIHRHSTRAGQPYVVIDCGALPADLIESELFGYDQGAFTGADHTKEGLVELANGGTLFLDEIGHIDATFQQKLLKFIETKTFRRIGAVESRTVDVRIIAATNKDLEAESKIGTFRADLWYRLNVLRLEIPPLRERRGDIPVLAAYFMQHFGHQHKSKTLSPEVGPFLEAYPWPGNVRELHSALLRAVTVAKSDVITPSDFNIGPAPAPASHGKPGGDGPPQSLRLVERHHIETVLSNAQGNVTVAAKMLEISRTTLYAKLKEYGIEHR